MNVSIEPEHILHIFPAEIKNRKEMFLLTIIVIVIISGGVEFKKKNCSSNVRIRIEK